MTTAVDTSVLLDVLIADSDHSRSSRQQLSAWSSAGLVATDIVYAELSPQFGSPEELDAALWELGITVLPPSSGALFLAGSAWAEYARRRERLRCANCGAAFPAGCSQCGARLAVRQHILADFIIGAHASVHAARLLTRDSRGFFRTYFPDLTLV